MDSLTIFGLSIIPTKQQVLHAARHVPLLSLKSGTGTQRPLSPPFRPRNSSCSREFPTLLRAMQYLQMENKDEVHIMKGGKEPEYSFIYKYKYKYKIQKKIFHQFPFGTFFFLNFHAIKLILSFIARKSLFYLLFVCCDW
jgi:hypothetical protein